MHNHLSKCQNFNLFLINKLQQFREIISILADPSLLQIYMHDCGDTCLQQLAEDEWVCIKLTLVATSCVAISISIIFIAGSHANQRRIRSLNHYNNSIMQKINTKDSIVPILRIRR